MTDPNPYRPGVGLTPPHLAGRNDEIERFRRVLRSAPEIPGNIRVSGLRGVGKTVLLKKLTEISEEQKWATINMEVQPSLNSESALQRELAKQGKNLEDNLSAMARFRSKTSDIANMARKTLRVSYEGFEWSLAGDLSEETKALGKVIVDAAETARKHGLKGVVVLLDEAQILTDDKTASGNHALSTLVAAVSTLQKDGAHVCLVLCGLPTLAVNLLNARTYSERMFQGIEVKSLTTGAAREAFVQPLKDSSVNAEETLIERVLKEVEGYPYFIQLWGSELWYATLDSGLGTMTSETLDHINARIYARLDIDFYEPRVASLTPAEQDLLTDSARCNYPPLMVADLNGQSPKRPGNINVLLGRLVAANVLYRPRKGQYHYTAPGFRDFLQRRSKLTEP